MPLFASLKEKPLDTWVEAFDRLYGVTNRDHSLMDIISRLVENAGEVAKALRERLPRERLEARLANVFAWIIAAYTKYSSIMGASAPSFADLVMKKYTHCAKCHSVPCECKPVVASVFVGMVSGDTFGADEEIENAASHERLPVEIVQDGGDEMFGGSQEKLAEVVVLRKARNADAAAIVLTHKITVTLQSLVYQSLAQGQPVQVFSRAVRDLSECDPELTKFLNRANRRII